MDTRTSTSSPLFLAHLPSLLPYLLHRSLERARVGDSTHNRYSHICTLFSASRSFVSSSSHGLNFGWRPRGEFCSHESEDPSSGRAFSINPKPVGPTSLLPPPMLPFPIPRPRASGAALACEWLCCGEQGELRPRVRLGMVRILLPVTEETSESVGSRSKFVFVDAPIAWCGGYRSTGDDANAH